MRDEDWAGGHAATGQVLVDAGRLARLEAVARAALDDDTPGIAAAMFRGMGLTMLMEGFHEEERLLRRCAFAVSALQEGDA